MSIKTESRIGASEVLFGLATAILLIVVGVPMALIFFNAFWVDGALNVAIAGFYADYTDVQIPGSVACTRST